MTASVDRIDFHQTGEAAWVVTKYTRCERGAYLPVERKAEPIFDVDSALSWCREHNWEVREWPNGARAWRNGVEPVRSSERAERMRRDGLLVVPPEWAELGYELDKINLQYDL
jgi:hypothetical protein